MAKKIKGIFAKLNSSKVLRFCARIKKPFDRLHSVWLFDRKCESADKKQKFIYYFYNFFLVILSGIIVGASALLLAYGPGYTSEIFYDYFKNPYILFLNILPSVMMTLLFYGIFGRGWIALLLDGAIIIGFSMANYYLLKFRDDPLMFEDLLHIREAAAISSEGYDYSMGTRMVLVIALWLVIVLHLFVFQRYIPKLIPRLSLTFAPILCAVPLKFLYFDFDVYNEKTRNNEHILPWSPTQLYISKGFVYPFIYSIKDTFGSEPEGYDEEEAKKLLSKYETEEIPEEKKVNVIGLMLEAFNDIETKGITGISPDVYACYRTVRDENYSGRLVTNIFGGETIESERAFLTGYLNLENYRNDVESYVRYFNDNGYYTEGGHPSEDWFYNRKNINGYLGFDNFYLRENYYEAKYGADGMRLDSNFVENDIFERFEKAKKENKLPYFGFNVSYQGHGPYATSYYEWGQERFYEGNVSDETKYIVRNYLGSCMDTGWRLMQLVNKIKAEEEPIVLVVFGDHMPWMGDGNSAYKELGVNLDVSTYEGFMNYYSTEYIIVANDAAKKVLGNDFTGKGPVTSPCFLMNLLFDEMGYKGPDYMQYTDSFRKNVPAMNDVGVIASDGKFILCENLPEKLKKAKSDFEKAEYYTSHRLK